jgi:hypothetical protein
LSLFGVAVLLGFGLLLAELNSLRHWITNGFKATAAFHRCALFLICVKNYERDGIEVLLTRKGRGALLFVDLRLRLGLLLV